MSSIVPFDQTTIPDCLRPEFDEPKSIIGIFHDSQQFRHRKYWSLPRTAFLLTRFESHSSVQNRHCKIYIIMLSTLQSQALLCKNCRLNLSNHNGYSSGP